MLPTALHQYHLSGYDRKDTYIGMLLHAIPSMGMYEHAQWAMIHDHPREECAELGRCQDIDLEHWDWMRPNWSHNGPGRGTCISSCSVFRHTAAKYSLIDSQLGKLQTHTLPEL